MRILILGGAGAMAEAIERDLLEVDADETSEMVIADMNQERLQGRVDALQDARVSSAVVDISDHNALVKNLAGFDIVVSAALAPTTLNLLKAALEAKVNIVTLATLDLPGAAPGAPLDELGLPADSFREEMNELFARAGLTAVLGLGSGPGTSNVMGRYFGDKLDRIESMEFSYAYAQFGGAKSLFPFDPRGMIGQYTMPPVILRQGKLVRVPPRYGRGTMIYPDPIGAREAFYVMHSEPVCFARAFRDKGLQDAGTKAGWGPEFLSKLEFLDSLGLLDTAPRQIGGRPVAPFDVLESGLTRDETVKTEDYGCFRLVIKGERAGEKIEYTADVFTGPYKNLNGTQHRTGIPAAVAARMLGRGEITRKGAFSPEIGVDPVLYFRELERRDIRLYYTVRYYA